jgi:M6 family metalloprotease-like protein
MKSKIYTSLVLIFLLLFLFTESIFAAFLVDHPTELIRPNGEKYSAFVTGDEFYHWVHDEKGFTILKNGTSGELYYAKKVGGKLVQTDLIPGVDNPAENGLLPYQILDVEYREEIRREFYEKLEKSKDENKILSAKKGTINNIVVFIRFSDEVEFSTAKSLYSNMHNASSGNSLKNFYYEASYGQLNVNSFLFPNSSGDAIVSYQDINPRSYYQLQTASNPNGYTTSNKTSREHNLLKRACESIANDVPAELNIDSDNNGLVDNVSFIVRGNPDEWSNLLWPHRWTLSTEVVYIRGKRVIDYNFNIESSTKNSVLSHEFFHTLGAPDLYHYNDDGRIPVGYWDLMSYSYSDAPKHMCSYMKYKYGTWIDEIPEITSAGDYGLNPLTNPVNNCYMIKSPNSSTEYFVIDYRKKEGEFESTLPGQGIVFYRINTSVPWGNAQGPPDEIYVYRLNGTVNEVGSHVSANFSSETGRTAFNNSTNPRCFLYDNTDADIFISEISSASNRINFRVEMGIQPPDLIQPANYSGGINSNTTFSWSAVEDADAYAIQVSDDQSFNTTVFYQTGITNNYYTDPTIILDNATMYYWRVFASNDLGFSDWSEVFSFKTALAPPIVVYPETDELGVPTTATFLWNELDGASEYSIEIADNLQFINPIINADELEDTLYVVNGLAKSKQYYWRVAGWDIFGIGDWSDAIPFVTSLDKPNLTYPENEVFGIKTTDTLIWEPEFSASDYDIQISDAADFSNLVLEANETAMPSQPFNELAGNTVHYWRVRANNENSISDWSDPWSFKTQTVPPTLLHPEDDSSGVKSKGRFNWNAVDGAISYNIQVSELPDFANIKIGAKDVSTPYYDYEGLSHNKRYYWRVASVDEGGSSEWSIVFSFTTNIGPPKLREPSENGLNIPVIAQFKWEAASGASTYKIQVSKDEFFESIVKEVDNIKGLNLYYDDLEFGTTYYWRVRSESSTQISDWSEEWEFTTLSVEFGLIMPQDLSHQGPIKVNFSWNKTPEIPKYNLLVSTDLQFSDIVVTQTFTNESMHTVDQLEFNKTYYWKVVGIVDQQEIPSETRSFFTDAEAPLHSTPLDNARGQALSGKVYWELVNDSKSYSYQFSDKEDFSNILSSGEGLTTNNGAYSDLEKSKMYYWRVKQVRTSSESMWSVPWSFSTQLAIPELVSPIDNLVTIDEGSCVWNPVDLATTYTVHISDNPDFGFTVRVGEDLAETKFEYTGLPDTLYYWRVKAIDGEVESDWSETGSFEVITTSVEEELIAKYNLQMHPNPFSEVLDISIKLNNDHYKIEFYDLVGNLLESKSGIGTGTQSIKWNAGGLNSGVYLIKFQINGDQFTRRVVLKK